MIASILKILLHTDPLRLLGLFFLSLLIYRFVLPFLLSFYRFFLRPSRSLRKLGEWAIITGATDGIGLAYANELAKKGMNLLLISRNSTKLTEVSNTISAKNGKIKIQTLPIDFSLFDVAAQYQLKETVKGMEVGVLINNVGQSYDHPEFFHSLDERTVQSLIDLNIKSTSIVTHIVLQGMVERKKGAIVNISSAASLFPSPLLAQYSAAKSYIDYFSRSLHAEYKNKGISVQTQNPLFVQTKLAKIRVSSLTVPSPSSYAKAGVKAIGYEEQCSPYWAHALQLAIVGLLPERIAIAYSMKMHLAIRKRALMKKESATKATKKQ